MPRKTINISAIKAKVNHILAQSEHGVDNSSLTVFIESLLMDANAYRGFRYLTQSEVRDGAQPGIIWSVDGPDGWTHTFDGCDQTRRAYA